MTVNIPEPVSVRQMPVTKVNGREATTFSDTLSVEEPLEIGICYEAPAGPVSKNISVTMRTPGNDIELALGFLFTEGILSSYEQVKHVRHADTDSASNRVEVSFAEDYRPQLAQADRNFYTTSSCGVCGKGSIESIKTVSPFRDMDRPLAALSASMLYALPQKLRAAQNNFSATGGIHASGLFSMDDGSLLLLREDVGRHNALDKLIGAALMDHLLPLNRHVLLLSGRASFELLQKASMAGIRLVAAIGAPSSLAVDLARESGITLLGFLRESRFNMYHLGENTVINTTYEDQDQS